jgi:hypothetical protein
LEEPTSLKKKRKMPVIEFVPINDHSEKKSLKVLDMKQNIQTQHSAHAEEL